MNFGKFKERFFELKEKPIDANDFATTEIIFSDRTIKIAMTSFSYRALERGRAKFDYILNINGSYLHFENISPLMKKYSEKYYVVLSPLMSKV